MIAHATKKPMLLKKSTYFHKSKRFNLCSQQKDINQILFLRNNVIIDTVQSLTSNPYVFCDDDNDDHDIIKNNKDIAMLYSIIILCCIAYIIISDMWDSNNNKS